MLKKFLHSSLVGMLLFSSFGNASLFAQQPPSLPEDPLFQAEPLQPDNEPEENDIYINIFQPQETDDQQIAQQIAQQHAQQHAQQGVVTPGTEPTPGTEEEQGAEQEQSVQQGVVTPGINTTPGTDTAPGTVEILGNASPSLKITEVYRLGTYERLEITNLSDTDFVGSLTLNGVKSSAFKLNNITIPAYASLLIADDKINGILNTEIIISSNAGLNFTDAEPINIELLVDGILLDTFNVDSTTVGANKNKIPRPSFSKLYDHGERKIEASSTDHNFNIEGFTANPGKFTIIGPDTPRMGEGPTPILPSQLIISEVYYDDYEFICSAEDIEDWRCSEEDHEYVPDEERIEIFNIGSGDFFGNFSLSGNIFSGNLTTYTYQNMSLPAGSYIVLANTPTPFKLPENKGLLINAEQSFPDFDIPDTETLTIELLIDEEIKDSFSSDVSWMQKWNDGRMSFQKVLLPDKMIITNSREYAVNNKSGYTINPGALLTTQDDDAVDYTIPKPPKPLDPTPFDACGEVEPDVFTLTEVFRGNDSYDPYLEFLLHEDIQWDYEFLLLTGSLLQTSLLLDLSEETESYDRTRLEKNTRPILAKTVGALSEAGLLTIFYHPDFTLNIAGGELELYGINGQGDGQSRQLLDIVQVLSGTSGKSRYHDGLIRRCGDKMDKVDDFSPGFGQEVLTYFSPSSTFTTKTVETVKYVGGGGGCSCPSKEQLCGITTEEKAVLPTEEITVSDSENSSDDPLSDEVYNNSLKSSEEILGNSSLKIISLEYKTPESITLQSFLPYDVDFTKHTYYLKSSTATTKKYIDGVLSAHSIDTFTKTFGFPDAGACITLYSGDVQLDNVCYAPTSSPKEPSTPLPSFDPSLYQIKILDITYDPDGADTDNETITLQNLSDFSIDLSNLKLKINTTNKKLTGTLSPSETKTFKGTFGFPNSTKDGSEVLVSLFYDDTLDTIFDTYLYNPNTPNVVAQSGEVKVYSVLDGDTFRFRKEDGVLQSVRLLGVDAPESTTTRYRTTECFGQEAKTYLTNLIKNQFVRLEYDDTQQSVDSYGRLLAYVYLGDTLINEKILLDGYAKEYTYKSDYEKQSSFQSAQTFAQTENVGLRSPSTCGVSIEDVPEVRGFDYDKLPLKITAVLYDPEGTDKDNEVIVVSLNNDSLQEDNTNLFFTLSGIDFSDNFKLTIFPRSEYTTGTTKNKSLETVGFLPLASSFTLTGDFQFPNEKATCVSLKYKEYTFDTFCYNPQIELEREEIILSGEIAAAPDLPSITIRSVLPNPSGSDTTKEEITLLRTVPSPSSLASIDNSLKFSEQFSEILLSSDFYLLINNKTKKKLNGLLLPNQEITIKGSFSFPNTASCITLMKGTEPIDSFCYGKPTEGVRYASNATSVAEIPAEELSLIKKMSLVRQGEKLCVSYNKVLFSCKVIPNSTTEQNAKLLSFQNNYLVQLQNYLRENYSLLYYNSDLRNLFDLYSTVKKEIKSGSYTFTRKGNDIPLTDVAATWSIHSRQSMQEYVIAKVVEHLPPSLLAYYQQERAKWYKELLK